MLQLISVRRILEVFEDSRAIAMAGATMHMMATGIIVSAKVMEHCSGGTLSTTWKLERV